INHINIIVQNHEELTFFYGRDTFLHCGVVVDTDEFYRHLVNISRQEQAWECRVAMSTDETINLYYPLQIPVWGIEQADHLDVANHINVVFHADEGLISAVSIYPIKDRHLDIRTKSVISFHGHIKWFRGTSFEELTSYNPDDEEGRSWKLLSSGYVPMVFVFLSTLIFSLLAAALLYKFTLKPRLIRKYLKND
ncbi:hypothetical protein SAMD00019534_109470, partial [Acytostelium subglobosum LB1]|uniref:hypothetical protein n=1 Tax=Acytostelium subglobosum LB1 TaxID=1410327 RepID=UPI000644F691